MHSYAQSEFHAATAPGAHHTSARAEPPRTSMPTHTVSGRIASEVQKHFLPSEPERQAIPRTDHLPNEPETLDDPAIQILPREPEHRLKPAESLHDRTLDLPNEPDTTPIPISENAPNEPEPHSLPKTQNLPNETLMTGNHPSGWKWGRAALGRKKEENVVVGEAGPRWVLGLSTVNETGPARVREPKNGAARPVEEHPARHAGPPTERREEQ